MKITKFALVVVFVVGMIWSSAFAGMISYDYHVAADQTLTTPYYAHPSVIIDTFDPTSPSGWTYTGNGAIVSGSVVNLYAAPYNPVLDLADPTQFFTVPENKRSAQSVKIYFGGATYDYLGLFWGSIDDYNKIQFFNGDEEVAVYAGLDIAPPADGNQTNAATNSYVNFIGMSKFDSIVVSSSEYAFEFDNLAVGNQVPVPGAVLLGVLGLGAAGMRLRKNKVA